MEIKRDNHYFVGCFTALVTPFNRNLEVDYEGLQRNVDFQIEEGISGLVPLGTTGEAPTINDEEREKIIKVVVDEANGKVPVIVGVGTNSTEKTVKQAKQAEDLGADALLVVAPYYNKPTQEGLYLHFRTVSEAVEIPIIVYNIPGRTGVNIEVNTLLRLSKLDNIIGVKEASGNIQQVMEIIHKAPKDFIVLSGDDNLTLPFISLGAKGVISVVSNILPKRVTEMVKAALEGRFSVARNIHYELLEIFKVAFIETNPIPIKAAMNILGMPAGPCRPPLCDLQPQNMDKLRSVIMEYFVTRKGR